MKITTIIAAAAVAGAMTTSSHAQDAPSHSPLAKATQASQDSAEKKTFVDLMRQVLRAGDATRTDPIVTGSTNAVANSGKAVKSGGSRPYDTIISHYAAQYGVPVSLAHAIIAIESNYRPSARGRAGEIGLMQIKPATARGMGYGGSVKGLYNPETNIKYGMMYLGKAFKLGGGNTCGAVLRYNAGHGAKRMNSISSAYCAKVKRILAKG